LYAVREHEPGVKETVIIIHLSASHC